MSIRCLRVYDLVKGEADPGDAHVVLVDRLWPRGVAKADLADVEWCRDAAPSDALRKDFHSGDVDYAHFSQRYRAELARGDAAGALGRLVELAGRGDLVLAYGARDTERNHAVVLADEIGRARAGTRRD